MFISYLYLCIDFFCFEVVVLSYEIRGKGKDVVVFLHGWGGDKKSLQSLIQPLENNFCCIAVQFPKMIESEIGRPYSIFCYASEVFTLLCKFNIQKISIVAHSFGGRVAIVLASVFHIQIDKMVLLDIAGLKYHFSFKKWYLKTKYRCYQKLVQLHLMHPLRLNNFGSDDYQLLSPFEKKSFVRVVICYLDKYLSKIKCSVLLIWGKQDNITPLYFAKRIHKKIKDSGLIVFPYSGHFCYLENTTQCQRIIKSFFGVKV